MKFDDSNSNVYIPMHCGAQMRRDLMSLIFQLAQHLYTVVQKNAPTLADHNYDPVQSILIML